jgi:hypothetical protein
MKRQALSISINDLIKLTNTAIKEQEEWVKLLSKKIGIKKDYNEREVFEIVKNNKNKLTNS